MGQLSVPDATRARLDELTTSLTTLLGADLVSLIVHGSAVRGEWRAQTSDVDVIVVLTEITNERLRAMSGALQVARDTARIEATILVAREIHRASDAFPLIYDDIKRCHVVLSGTDPFAELEIPQEHLRVRIEQELREGQMRLRRAVTYGGQSTNVVARAVRMKVRQLRGVLRALLIWQGLDCGETLAAVYLKAGEIYNVATEPLLNVDAHPDDALEALFLLLQRAVNFVDRLI